MIKNITQIKSTLLALVVAFGVLAKPLGLIDADSLGVLTKNLNEIISSVIAIILLFSKDPK